MKTTLDPEALVKLAVLILVLAFACTGCAVWDTITTPAASPESNGMSEAFVNTMRRDYLAGADLATAEAVLAQIPAWIADYNAVAPHSALGYQSPQQYRSTRLMVGPKC